MDKSVIVKTPDPMGKFIEGYLRPGQTVYPGMHVIIDPTMEPVDGRPGYKLWDGAASGERSSVVLVRENELLGGGPTTPYTDGARFFGYIPLPGDEVLVRFANVGTGTGTDQEDIVIGDKLILEDGTGNVIVTTGSPEDEVYEAMETISDIVEDVLVLARRI